MSLSFFFFFFLLAASLLCIYMDRIRPTIKELKTSRSINPAAITSVIRQLSYYSATTVTVHTASSSRLLAVKQEQFSRVQPERCGTLVAISKEASAIWVRVQTHGGDIIVDVVKLDELAQSFNGTISCTASVVGSRTVLLLSMSRSDTAYISLIQITSPAQWSIANCLQPPLPIASCLVDKLSRRPPETLNNFLP